VELNRLAKCRLVAGAEEGGAAVVRIGFGVSSLPVDRTGRLMAPPEDEAEHLKAHYRLMLAEQGFVIAYTSAAVFRAEV
jgi:hypothetical protein